MGQIQSMWPVFWPLLCQGKLIRVIILSVNIFWAQARHYVKCFTGINSFILAPIWYSKIMIISTFHRSSESEELAHVTQLASNRFRVWPREGCLHSLNYNRHVILLMWTELHCHRQQLRNCNNLATAKQLSKLKMNILRRYFSQTSCSCKEISPSWSWRLSTNSLSVRISLSISCSRRSTRSETLTWTNRSTDIIELLGEEEKQTKWPLFFIYARYTTAQSI